MELHASRCKETGSAQFLEPKGDQTIFEVGPLKWFPFASQMDCDAVSREVDPWWYIVGSGGTQAPRHVHQRLVAGGTS